MPLIRLFGIPPFNEQLVEGLVDPLHSIFRLPVENGRDWTLDPSFAFDPYRNQYNSTSIISGLLQHFPSIDGRVLGITTSDFFVPVLTYVFGEAQLGGPVAVVSSHRLDDTLYGLPANPDLLAERLLKEAVHELGHTFGLIHCRDYRCVMHTSTTAEDIDIKSERFCAACEATVSKKRDELLRR